MKNKPRIILLLISLTLLIIHLTMLDYSDLSWGTNSNSYTGIIAMMLLAFAMLAEIKRTNTLESPSEK